MKTTISCRIATEKKERLQAQFKEKGFGSLNDYLTYLLEKGEQAENQEKEESANTKALQSQIKELQNEIDELDLARPEVEVFCEYLGKILNLSEKETEDLIDYFNNNEVGENDFLEMLKNRFIIEYNLQRYFDIQENGMTPLVLETNENTAAYFMQFVAYMTKDLAANEEAVLIGNTLSYLESGKGMFGDAEVTRLFEKGFLQLAHQLKKQLEEAQKTEEVEHE